VVLVALHHFFGDFDTELGRDACTVVWICSEEVAELEHLNFFAGVSEGTGDAGGEAVFLGVIKHAVEIARLGVVIMINS